MFTGRLGALPHLSCLTASAPIYPRSRVFNVPRHATGEQPWQPLRVACLC